MIFKREKNILRTLCFVIIIVSSLMSCSEEEEPKGNNDNIGEYQDVRIGSQRWMKGNLNTSKFRNGDNLSEANSEVEWNQFIKNKKPAYCYYEFDAKNGAKYGKLYNFFALIDERGLAPEGWRLPNFKDWIKVESLMGVRQMASTNSSFVDIWLMNNDQGGGNVFLSIPGGFHSSSGEFLNKDISSHWWEGDLSTHAYATHNNPNHSFAFESTKASMYFKDGLSVRCIK